MKERQPLTIRRNFSWTFLGNTFYAASQWGMLTVLAKLGTPQMVGQFALALAIVTPVITFANLSLRQIQATDARGAYLFGDYLALRLSTTLLAFFVIAGIAFATHYGAATLLVILILGLAKSMEAISDVFYGLLQHHEQMDRIAVSMIIKGFLSLVALGIGVRLMHSVFWGVVGLAVAWAVVLLGYDIRSGALVLQCRALGALGVKEMLRPRWTAVTLRELVLLALPLGLAASLISYSINIPRYFIKSYHGEHDLGIYSALAYVLMAGTTIVSALGQAASPRLAQYYATNNFPAFRRLMIRLVAIGALMGIAGIGIAFAVGRQLLTLLYRPEYGRYQDVFLWLLISAGIGYMGSFLGYGITATRIFRRLTFPYFLQALISALLSFLLIPRFGMMGAAWSLCGVSLASCVIPLLLFASLERGRMNGSAPEPVG